MRAVYRHRDAGVLRCRDGRRCALARPSAAEGGRPRLPGDADRRGLPELKPLLETLARSTEALRSADERQRLRAPSDPPHGPASS